MIAPWLAVGLWLLGILAVAFVFVWALCRVAADADEMLEQRAAHDPDEDAWDHALATDPSLATWAHDTVNAPDQDRDLGQFAAWADSVTDRRAS